MSTKMLWRLAGQVINQPLLITPAKAEEVTGVLAGRIGLDFAASQNDIAAPTPDAGRLVGESRGKMVGDFYTEYYRLIDHIAVVTIDGSLVNRGGYVGAPSGLVSYEGIKAQIDMALEDNDVSAILLDLESQGGEAVGCFETASYLRQVSAVKPIHALVDGVACSAAYALASGCSHITSIPTGRVGSIGVVLVHVDRSEAMQQAGLKPTFIHAGAHKTDGNPYEPLPDSVRDDLQANVSALYDAFVSHVADHRPMSADDIRSTEARVFSGQEALEVGLIDQVGTFEDAIQTLTNAVDLTAQHKGLSMSQKQGQAAAAGDHVQMSAAELDAKLASAKDEGFKQGVKAEQDRLEAIMGLEEAEGRSQAALAAVKNGLTVEQAKGQLPMAMKDPSTLAAEQGELQAAGAAAYEEERRKAQANMPDIGSGAKSTGEPKGASFASVMSTVVGEV